MSTLAAYPLKDLLKFNVWSVVVWGNLIAIVTIVMIIVVAWPIIASGAGLATAFASGIAATGALSTAAVAVGSIQVAAALADRILINDEFSPKGGEILTQAVLLSAPLVGAKLFPRALPTALKLRFASAATRGETSIFTVGVRQWNTTLVVAATDKLAKFSDVLYVPTTVLTGVQAGADVEAALTSIGSKALDQLVVDLRAIAPPQIPLATIDITAPLNRAGFTDFLVPLTTPPLTSPPLTTGARTTHAAPFDTRLLARLS